MSPDALSAELPRPELGGHGRGVGHFKSQAAFDRFAAAYADAFALLPREHQRLDLDTSFGRVRCYRFGAGPATPVVLVPGRNASTPMWAANLPFLMKSRRVYCLDALGEAGASIQSRALTGHDDQARWVAEALGQLGEGPVHLVGYSLGGWLAVQVAIRHPDSLLSAAVLDPPATFARLSARFIAGGLLSAVPATPEWLRHRLLGWITGAAPTEAVGPEARLAMAALRGFRVRQPVPTMPSEQQLHGVELPMLALVGGRSRVHDPRAAVARADVLPAGTVELWPDASHLLSAEFPQRLAERLDEWWES